MRIINGAEEAEEYFCGTFANPTIGLGDHEMSGDGLTEELSDDEHVSKTKHFDYLKFQKSKMATDFIRESCRLNFSAHFKTKDFF